MAEQAGRESASAGEDGQGAILVVEDDERWRNMLSSLVTKRLDGVVVETVDSVSEAQRKIAQNRYSCYICDYALDDGDGLAVLAAARERDPEVPFVLVTGHGSERVASEAIREGVTDYIIKDQIDAGGAVLLNRVENALSEYRTRNKLRKERQVKSAITDIVAGGDEDVFTGFCSRLVANTAYDCAWIATRDEHDRVHAHAHAGTEKYIEEVVGAGLSLDSSEEPTVRALRTDSFVEFPADGASMADVDPRPGWLDVALDCGFTRALAVPIRYEGISHGVLGVYATERVVVDDTRMLTEYADFIAFAFQTTQWKQSLLSNDAVRVEFRVEDRTLPSLKLARLLPEDARVEIVSIIDRGEDDLYMLSVDGADASEVEAAVARIDRLTPIAIEDGRTCYEVAIAGEMPEDHLGRHGANFHRTVIEDGAAVVTAAVPDREDVSMLLEVMEADYGEVTVLMMKQVDGEHADAGGGDPLHPLTDRQRETLEYAYYAGFFDRPQAATAEDIATALDVSSSTVLYHLRTAERKLLGTVFRTT